MPEKDQYAELGVDAMKSDVSSSFGVVVTNDFPRAFVVAKRDPLHAGWVICMHGDGDGSKTVQRLLHYLETRDEAIFQETVDDELGMNTGDIAASGFIDGPYEVIDLININGFNVPKNVIMDQIAIGFANMIALYEQHDIPILYFGGETADLVNQVTTCVNDAGVRATIEEKWVISGDNVQPDDSIWSFSSGGQATWEKSPNSGVMSNGHTLAQHVLMHTDYAEKYPYLVRPEKPYRGKYRIDDSCPGLPGMTVSEAMLSPTRQWALVIKMIVDKLKSRNAFHLLHGISQNTGGGNTKIAHVGENIRYVKTMPEPLPLFKLIQDESGDSWEKMFRNFNCGHGIDVVGSDEGGILQAVLAEVSKETGIKHYLLGFCEKSDIGENYVVLETEFGTFDKYHIKK